MKTLALSLLLVSLVWVALAQSFSLHDPAMLAHKPAVASGATEVFYVSGNNSDLSAGERFNFALDTGANLAGSNAVRFAPRAYGSSNGYSFTAPGSPVGWVGGTFTSKVTIVGHTGAGYLYVYLARINGTGAVQASAQLNGMSITGSGPHVLSGAPNLGTWEIGQRLRLQIFLMGYPACTNWVAFGASNLTWVSRTPSP